MTVNPLAPIQFPAGDPVLIASTWCEAVRQPIAVLVVEDDASDLQVMKIAASKYHVELLEAMTGEEALRVLAERPDCGIAILDLHMPDLSGAELLAAVARVRPGIRVLVFSGYIDPASVDALNHVQLCPCVPKPSTGHAEVAGKLFKWFGVPSRPGRATV